MSNFGPISLEERRNIQLSMLLELDKICRDNNIRYSLAYGTLLGAIRHKGYIPWDDDVDIMMPLEDISKLKKILPSSNMMYCDVDTIPTYETTFPRLADCNTYRMSGKKYKTYGVCIDLYPFFRLKQTTEEQLQLFLKNSEKLRYWRHKFDSLRLKIFNRIPIKSFFPLQMYVKWMRDYVFTKGGEGKYYLLHGGPFLKRNVFDCNLFEEMMECDFEGHKFMCISKVHEYLTQEYGDYMTPPPESKRIPYHGANYYRK